MITFFQSKELIYAVEATDKLSADDMSKLEWLFAGASVVDGSSVSGYHIGPRAAMITPWSTNAVEITQNMSISGIKRIEQYNESTQDATYDPMLMQKYDGLDQTIFSIDVQPEEIKYIDDIKSYNESEGLALSADEVDYLNELAKKIGRQLTDSEVFGFSQVNSEHCRHKIFNGTFVIDGEEQPHSLFQMIKMTSKEHPDNLVSAYKDNVAFVKGPEVTQFAPSQADQPSDYKVSDFQSVLSLKAETHNFPTTVEPFNGAATGSGGEIRDRLAGGQGSIPMAGTAVYMTSYSRLNDNRPWEDKMAQRDWLYQTPMDILIKASNGASDFGNKFGQPLISGSLLTFEHEEHARKLGFDKVIMLAGGIGYAKESMAQKGEPQKGDEIVMMGGDNYRIGMGGAAVSSADTGEFSSGIELNAVQRSNPEMQKRVANAIRALVESEDNPIVSIHDHGAGGHLNCLSELVEDTGGRIDLEGLPVGDPTLSAKEIIGNESQERMGLVIHPDDHERVSRVAERERAPMYKVGDVTGDHKFTIADSQGNAPMDLELSDMFGSSPKTIMSDQSVDRRYDAIDYDKKNIDQYIKDVLRLEAVACKDWLTNKVDRCVGGKVAVQQCVGPLQLPLNNCAVMALDFDGTSGVATSIGHSPIGGLIDAAVGAQNAIAECLTNLVFAPVEGGLSTVSLSANWMWPCRNEGEDARLYQAVKATSDMAIALGINIPTGKDSLSMAQKYGKETVIAPGTVIISSVAHCDDFTQVVEPVLQRDKGDIYYINLAGGKHELGGSSFAQTRGRVGAEVPRIADMDQFRSAFEAIQGAIRDGMIVAGHDVSAGGLITTLLEMCFADVDLGAELYLDYLPEGDIVKLLFAENAGVVLQASDDSLEQYFADQGVKAYKIGHVTDTAMMKVDHGDTTHIWDIAELRDVWYETSYLLDDKQTANGLAKDRYDNYKAQPLNYTFPSEHTGAPAIITGARPQAAIIREKGSNSEREMANSLYKSGFAVRDVHMTDLVAGRETLEDVKFLGLVGGFSNSDVLGSAKGWAGAFKYNERAKEALEKFYDRKDTLSLGICNGCQLMLELDLINPDHEKLAKMRHNRSMKHESSFTSVTIAENESVMMSHLAGSTLGVWISHGEGRFDLPLSEDRYNIVAKYGYAAYPSNPNNSDYNAAMVCSDDGRHLATMPHIERSYFAWNWAHYPADRRSDKVSPWALAFDRAKEWI